MVKRWQHARQGIVRRSILWLAGMVLCGFVLLRPHSAAATTDLDREYDRPSVVLAGDISQRVAQSVSADIFRFSAHPEAVSVADYPAIDRWGQSLGALDWTQFQCARVAEQTGTILCLFSHSFLMSAIFANAALSIEGGRAALDGRQSLLGIDLKTADLVAYRQSLPGQDCSSNDRLCQPSPERAFLTTVLPALIDHWQAEAIIAAPWGNRSTIEHELLHGQFFADPAFQSAIYDFWHHHLSDAAKTRIKQEFSGYYRTDDEDLVINEFQAYTLQSQAGSFLGSLRSDWRSPLLSFLKSRQIQPHLRPNSP